MQRLILFSWGAAMLLASCSFQRDYNPTAHLTVQQQDQLTDQVIRYMGRPPDGVPVSERFNRAYDQHYADQKRIHRLDALYEDDENYYFLFSRIAPSLTEKRVAIGGKLRMDADMRITYYEEIFRTWKMEPDTLVRRGVFLFDKMVNGEDLRPYCSYRSGNTDYIEFPDDRTYFDTKERIWRTK